MVFILSVCAALPARAQSYSSPITHNYDRSISVWKGDNFPSAFYFPLDRDLLMRDYRNNSIMFAAIDALLSNDSVVAMIDTIEIVGACSPVGSEEYNLRLALRRCAAMRTYLAWKHRDVLYSHPVKYHIIGIDHLGYNILTEAYPMMREKEKWNFTQYAATRLKMKDGSYIVPGADKSKPSLIPGVRPLPTDNIQRDTVIIERDIRDTIYLKPDTLLLRVDTVQTEPLREEVKRPFFMAAKTNLIYNAALLPNLSLEFYLGRKWSLVAEGNWSWWTFDKPIENLWYHRIQAAGLELRKWVSSKYPLQGHAIGINALYGNYDVRLFTEDQYTKGQLSYQSWSAGLTYAYSMEIGKRFNLEFGLGFGYAGGRYYIYDRCTDHALDADNGHWAISEIRQRNYWGPTRVGVSLVWLLGTGNRARLNKDFTRTQTLRASIVGNDVKPNAVPMMQSQPHTNNIRK